MYNERFKKSVTAGESFLENLNSSDWTANNSQEPPPYEPGYLESLVEHETANTSGKVGVRGCSEPPKIPTTEERPCYRVFDKPLKDGEKTLRAGVWYFSIRQTKDDTFLEQKWICSPIRIEAVTRDDRDNNFGRLLRFRNTLGSWREWGMPMELLKGSGEELRGALLNMGVQIDPKSKNDLSKYLQSLTPRRRIYCALSTGWYQENFVLPDCIIGPKASNVIFQTGECNYDEYTIKGTLDGWREEVSKKAIGNPLLILGISAAFAGPLLSKCNAEGGGFHFVGDSSTGKTTIIDAACSVWGGKNFKRSWRATANGIEGAAQLFNDCLLALDEISECEPREIGKIVYCLGNGYGKQRASRSGAAREVSRWRCFILSSGERTIATSMQEGGLRSKAGQEVRVLTISATGRYGVFDNLCHSKSGSALSDAIKKGAAEHHGHGGRVFLEKLTLDQRNFPDLLEKSKAVFDAFNYTDGQERRAAARFAVAALAGELATEYGITGWKEGDAIEAARLGFDSWTSTRQGGNDEIQKMVEAISEYIEKYGDARFTPLLFDEKSRIIERSGFFRDKDGDRQYLFNSSGLRIALEGFDFKRAIKQLSSAGILPEPDRSNRISRALVTSAGRVRLYPVTLKGDKYGD